MAKRSRKRDTRSGKDNAGCMWGLINMFDFRQGPSNQKLLSDRKRGSARHFGTKYSRSKLEFLSDSEEAQRGDDGVNESGEGNANEGVASVKSLMEEEMSMVYLSKKSSDDEVTRIHSELGIEAHSLDHTYQNSKVISDLVCDPKSHKRLPTHQLDHASPTERPSFNLDLAAFIINFYSGSQQLQEKSKSEVDSCPFAEAENHMKFNYTDEPEIVLAQKQSVLHKALDVVADVFLRQKLSDTEPADGAVYSKEFMDALAILKSNKEILLTLLQDPASLLLKHTQGQQSARDGKLFKLELSENIEAEFLKEVGSSRQYSGPADSSLLSRKNGYNIFRKKDKSKEGKLLKANDSSHALNRIVVLKPSLERAQSASVAPSPSPSHQSNPSLRCEKDGDRFRSQFSLKEIRRRLRHVISESRQGRDAISVDGILHRVPYGSKDSSAWGKHIGRDNVTEVLTNNTSYSDGHASRSSAFAGNRNECVQLKECRHSKNDRPSIKDNYHRRTGSSAEFFNEEAKKHLVELLDTRAGMDIMPTRHVSKSLGKLLSLPEYNLLSPKSSPGRDKVPGLSPSLQLKQVGASDKSSPLIQDTGKTSCGDGSSNGGANMVDSNRSFFDSHTERICIEEVLHEKGNTQVVETSDILCREEYHQLDILSKSNGSDLVVPSAVDGEGSSMQLDHDSEEKEAENSFVSTSPVSCLVKNTEDNESILENSEQPSPISVLEPFPSEDVNSIGTPTAELPIYPQSIHFGEYDIPSTVLISSDLEANRNDKGDRFEYVKTVLEVSGLSSGDISDRWQSTTQLLNPSLFDEVVVSIGQLSEDPKLVFDCIGEVLAEIQERHFGRSPWVSFIKPDVRPIPIGGNLIQEVCGGINRHVQWSSPQTLDQIVGKDMENGTWLDLRFEAESMVMEMEDALLDDLVEEMAVDMWAELWSPYYYNLFLDGR